MRISVSNWITTEADVERVIAAVANALHRRCPEMNERELLQQGLDHHHAGRAREAADRYQRVLRSNPMQPDALYLLGVLSHQTGNQEAAIELTRRAIRVAGEQPRLHEILGSP